MSDKTTRGHPDPERPCCVTWQIGPNETTDRWCHTHQQWQSNGGVCGLIPHTPHDWLRARDRSCYECLRCEATHDGEWEDDAEALAGECQGEGEPTCDCGVDYGTALLFGHRPPCALLNAYFEGGWRPQGLPPRRRDA